METFIKTNDKHHSNFTDQRPRVVSGMRSTGTLHLGHYHGVLKNWLKLQHQYECLFFIADWHALTTHYETPEVIACSIIEMAIDWLAVGIDPSIVKIFVQSHVPAHAELHVLLSMITPLSWLERVPTYKDQQEQLREKHLATYGFLGYPILQSADVLAYKAGLVPVGEDQISHIEVMREISRRFNHLYAGKHQKNILPEPQPLLADVTKLSGLDGRKMSKSYGNTISLREKPEAVEKKIRVMPTDPARIKRTDKGEPEKCPVWSLHKVYADDETQTWVQTGCRTAGIGCLECKQVLIKAIQQEQAPFIERAKPFEENPETVRDMLREGALSARKIADETLGEVRCAMKLD